MSTTRKRTKASLGPDEPKDEPTIVQQKDVSELQAKSGSSASKGRTHLKIFFALLSILCLSLTVLPHLWSDESNIQIEFSAPQVTSLAADESRKEKAKPKAKEPAQPIPFTSSLPFSLPSRSPPSTIVRSADATKQAAVRDAFQDSWNAYVEDAFGADEYHPISQSGSNFSVDGGVGYFIIDTLDVLLIMGEEEGYKRARDWVRGVDWNSRSGKFSVFETTIRTLGGLLSAHALCQAGADTLSPTTSQLCSKDDASMFLEKAIELAERLSPAFEETKLGIPLREVDFQSGQVYADVDNHNASSLAEVASIQLEFKYLAHVTDDERWWTLAEKPMRAIRKASIKAGSDGLLPIFISPYTGEMYLSEIRLGSRGDSYYEYLIKQYVQTNHSEAIYDTMYKEAAKGIKRHLLKQTYKSKLLFTSEIEPRVQPNNQRPTFTGVPKQDHLVCFLGGSYMLGAIHASLESGSMTYPPLSIDQFTPLALEDWTVGHELIRTCVDTYQGTKTGLSAEISMFRPEGDTHPDKEKEDWYIKKRIPNSKYPSSSLAPLIDARNILRPETVESLFIAFHLTGDEIYRTWGWEIFESFVRCTKIRKGEKGRVGAFTSIRNVEAEMKDIEREDRMETFWLAETLKYLYLLFSDQDTLRLDQWVLNTEAHPLPVFQPQFETTVF